jgi:hypothetical protein
MAASGGDDVAVPVHILAWASSAMTPSRNWARRQLELALERARHGREQVHVDERAGKRKEDLLRQHPAQHAREIRAGDDRDEHQQHHEGAMFAGRKPFSATPAA